MAENIDDLIHLDLQHVWHPCTQMKDLETYPPLPVVGAEGAYLHMADGRKVLDGISSWWCKSLGHGHPALRQALVNQAEQFEHVILANTTHEGIAQLSAQLAMLCPPLDKVSYASDGSCAVEMALKMSVDAHRLQGQPQRRQFLCLQNSYHGETALTLAVSDCGLYKDQYASIMPTVCEVVSGVPYVSGTKDPLWADCGSVWTAIEAQLAANVDQLAGVIFEPVLQGAGGMQVYSMDLLRRLRNWTQVHGVHLIADEIMTGFGRTGMELACQHAAVVPDFLCLGKGLTAGWLPLSVMLTSTEIYDLFYDDYETGKAFLHSHTHSGNALAVAVANATLQVYREEATCQHVQTISQFLRAAMQAVADETGKLKNVRGLGAVVAADINQSGGRLGYAVAQQATAMGVLLRPLGNTLYWLPPLNIGQAEIELLQQVTTRAIFATLS